MPAMRSQVSSLQQNGLTFGIPNMRGNWNSLMGGCAVIGFTSLLCRGAASERGEETLPTHLRVEDAEQLVAARPVEIEPAVLEFDARGVLALGGEAHLHFRFYIGVVLPVGSDFPGEYQPGR